MKVSVIVPHLSADEFRPRMEAQLNAQTYSELEIVFVEDSERRGPAWARNRGLERATGEIVLFADVDDKLAPDWVEKMVKGLGDADLGWCTELDAAHYDELKRARPFLWRQVFGYRLADLVKAFLPGGLWHRCRREMAGVWKLAIRRQALGSVRFEESLRLYEDAMYIAALGARAKSLAVFSAAGYEWLPRADGTMAKGFGEDLVRNKFAVRDVRLKLDPTLSHHRGTRILSFLELMRRAGLRTALRYIRNLTP